MNAKDAQSPHYLGTKGEQYFHWQRQHGDDGGAIDRRNFQRYIKEGDCVLDFGCGGGFLLRHLACARRLGIEINPAAALVAEDNGIECFNDLSELPDLVVDVAISNHALEHVTAPVAVLAKLYQLLKSDGMLILKLPIDDWRAQRRIKLDDLNHHLYTWTPQLLFNCLNEAGFDKRRIAISIYSHAWFPGYARAFRILPEFLFDFGCRVYSILRKQRQLIAIATKP